MFLTSTRIKFKHLEIQYKHIWPLWVFLTNLIMKIRFKRKCKLIKNKQIYKVGFLVSDISKWKYDSLYNLLQNNNKFYPFILAYEANKNNTYTCNARRVYTFFQERGYNVINTYNPETGKYIDLSDGSLDMDILVYQQPWYLTMDYNPFNTSRFFLTISSSYGFNLTNCYDISYKEFFHRFVDICFTENEETKMAIIDHVKSVRTESIKVVGCLNLDFYKTTNIDINRNKKFIIYAPHHPLDADMTKLSTFTENAYTILELAKKHREYVWVYKPHPLLMESVITMNIFSEIQYREYLDEWKQLGFVHETPDYFDLFLNSICMITDSCGFLIEYLPTEMPIIHLRNKHDTFASFAKKYLDSFYDIYDFSKLDTLFTDIIINNNDYKKEKRIALCKDLIDRSDITANNMLNVFLDTISK